LIHLHGVSKGYGGRTLFEGVDWDIKPAQRVGLVGPNGAGKTTLFSIITGDLAADAGVVRIAREVTVGHLPQEVALIAGRSVRSVAREGLERVLAVGRALTELEGRMAVTTGPELEVLMDQYGHLQARFEGMGGFLVESRVEEILCGLGFARDRLDRDCGELSGGWQMRVALARLLLMHPDVLLLDEPTNHLDLESLVWLEGFLRTYRGTLVMISHDRAFLNGLCTHIAELSGEGLRLYTGDFESYLEQVAQRQALLERQQKNQDRKIAELQRFVDRFRYKATKARQAQSRLKQLTKLEGSRVELDAKQRTIHFALPEPPRSGRVVLTLENVRKAYGPPGPDEKVVYRGLDLQLVGGAKIALVGPNGAGKSTLLKLLAGVTPYQSGHREPGPQSRLFYFAQHQVESLDLRRTVLEEALAASQTHAPTFVRSILGAFLFSGEDADKRVGVLSGGEKNRLALAKMLLTPANVLLLDEPTNHLDMASCAVLEAALGEFTGTIVLISHDRHFMDEVVEEVWEVADGRVTPFPGNYTDYLDRCARGDRPAPLPLHDDGTGARRPAGVSPKSPAAPPAASPAPPPAASSGPEPGSIDWGGSAAADVRRRKSKDEKRVEAEARQKRIAATRPLRDALESAEKAVGVLEDRLSALRARQADPAHYGRPDEVREVAREVAEREAELASAYERWERAVASLEAAENALESAGQ
jgi:ATP-binding cassette subfamily F protein 3